MSTKTDEFNIKRRRICKDSTSNPSTKAATANRIKREVKEAKRESFGVLNPADMQTVWSSSDEAD